MIDGKKLDNIEKQVESSGKRLGSILNVVKKSLFKGGEQTADKSQNLESETLLAQLEAFEDDELPLFISDAKKNIDAKYDDISLYFDQITKLIARLELSILDSPEREVDIDSLEDIKNVINNFSNNIESLKKIILDINFKVIEFEHLHKDGNIEELIKTIKPEIVLFDKEFDGIVNVIDEKMKLLLSMVKKFDTPEYPLISDETAFSNGVNAVIGILNDIDKKYQSTISSINKNITIDILELKSNLSSLGEEVSSFKNALELVTIDNTAQLKEMIQKLDSSLLEIKNKIESNSYDELSAKLDDSLHSLKKISENDAIESLSEKIGSSLNTLKMLSVTNSNDVLSTVKDCIEDLKDEIKQAIYNDEKSEMQEINSLIEESKELLNEIEVYMNSSASKVIVGIKTYFDEIKHEVVSDSASHLNEMISRLDESFLEIKDRIEGNSVELLTEKVDNSINMLKELSESNSLDVFETVKECIDEIKNDIKYTVEEKSRTEIQEINVLIDGIKLILNDIEKSQSESSAEVITGVKAYVDEIKSEVFSDNADQVSEIVTKLDTSLLGIKDKIDNLANVELSEKVNASVELLKELSEKDIADDVSQKVQALLDSLKKDSETGLSDVISAIKTDIDDLKAEIKESIESAQKSDNFEINDLINQVKTTLGDIENYVGKSSSEIVAGIKTYIDEVRHEVVTDSNAQIDDIVSRFDNSLSEIKTQIESYPNELLLGKLDESLEFLKQLSEAGADEELLEQINAIKEQMSTYSNSELLEKLDESLEAINKISELSNDKELIEKIDTSFLEIKTQLESYPSEVLIEKLDESLDVLKQLSEAGADEELLEQINAIKEQMSTYSNSELLEKLDESLEAINKISELSKDKELIEKIDASFLEIKNQIDSYSNEEVIKKLDKSLEAISKVSEVKASQELIDKIDEIKSHIETYSNDELIKKLDESIEAFKNVSEVNVNEALIEKIDVLKTQIEESSFDELVKKLDKSIDMLGALSGSETNDELTDKIDESLALMRKFSETSSPDVLAMLKDCIDDLKAEIKTYIDNKPAPQITVTQGDGEPIVTQDTQQINNLVEDIKALLLDIEESMGTSSTEIVTGIKSCFDEMRNELKNEVVLLDSKIQSGISKIGGINTQKDLEELKAQVNSVVSELISQLITIFDNVSFDEESEDIKDFIYESSEGIRYDIQQIKHAVFGNNQEYDEESGIFEIVKKLEELSTIQNNNVESVLQILKNGVADEDNYTLTDVETDFAKIRLTLNDISSKSEEYKELSCKFGDTLENINKISSSLSNLDSINEDYVKTINNSFVDLKYDFQNIVQQFEKFNDDITNLSLCTNKLILKSEDSTNVLKDNLDSFRTMITQSEPDKIQTILSNMTFAMNDSVKLFDRKINELKKDIDRIYSVSSTNNAATENIKNSFLFMAEWMESAGRVLEDLGNEIVNLKTLDLDKISKEMDFFQQNSGPVFEKLDYLCNEIETLKSSKLESCFADLEVVKESVSELLNGEKPSYQQDIEQIKLATEELIKVQMPSSVDVIKASIQEALSSKNEINVDIDALSTAIESKINLNEQKIVILEEKLDSILKQLDSMQGNDAIVNKIKHLESKIDTIDDNIQKLVSLVDE